MADTYLGFFENQDRFEVADYFQINASHALIHYDKKTQLYTRTSYGAAYELIRSVFEGAQIYQGKVKSTPIGSAQEAANTVTAAAVNQKRKNDRFRH